MNRRHRHASAERIDQLRQLEPFRDCTVKELRLIDTLMTQVDVPGGSPLTVEGARGRQCFLVVDGSVVVERGGGHLAFCGPGEWVGELALLGCGIRSATATTIVATRVLAASDHELRSLMALVPSVACALHRVGNERMAVNVDGGSAQPAEYPTVS